MLITNFYPANLNYCAEFALKYNYKFCFGFCLSMLGLVGYACRYQLTKESQTSNHDWSSSPIANNSNNAWGVNFNHGNDNNNNRSHDNRVRLVRSGA